MRHDPAAGAIVIMLRSLKMYGMAQAITDLIEQGAPDVRCCHEGLARASYPGGTRAKARRSGACIGPVSRVRVAAFLPRDRHSADLTECRFRSIERVTCSAKAMPSTTFRVR